MRVRDVINGTRIYIEMQNGSLGWIDTPHTTDFEAGQIVLIRSDRIEHAPADMWREEPFVSVVRIKDGDTTVLEFADHLRTVPTNAMPYEIGNTVEALSTAGAKPHQLVPRSDPNGLPIRLPRYTAGQRSRGSGKCW